jgi:hypothetical protein
MKSSILAIATSFIVAVAADYVIDPSSVSLAERENWCDNELSTCPIICSQTAPGRPQVNTCDAATLTYGCVCENGLQPNVSEYSLTLPYFVCQEWGNQCQENCADSACATSCREDNPCGAQEPTRVNETTSASATASQTGATATDDTAIHTGLDGTGASETASAGTSQGVTVRALEKGSLAGFFVLVASVCAGVVVML